MEVAMNKSSIVAVSAALAAACLPASPSVADVIYEDGKPYLTDVSGFTGAPVSIAGSIEAPYRALSRIEWDERRNHPCFFNVDATHMNAGGVQRYTVNRCGTSGQPAGDVGSSSGFKSVWTNDAYAVYVSGVRVCMNNQDTRVKGLEIRAGVVENDRVVAYADWTPPADSASGIGGRSDQGFTTLYLSGPAERPNCNGNWKRWVECRAGELPSALYLHFDSAAEPASLTGVQLACRAVLPKT
jgi:hypothetical protein